MKCEELSAQVAPFPVRILGAALGAIYLPSPLTGTALEHDGEHRRIRIKIERSPFPGGTMFEPGRVIELLPYPRGIMEVVEAEVPVVPFCGICGFELPAGGEDGEWCADCQTAIRRR